MANTLGYYNPLFYAQEALIQLEKALGMASRVHRGYEQERRSFNRGEYINIRKPSTFSAQDAPATAEDIVSESVQIQLAYWREVKFKLTDKELAFTSQMIIDEHIRPAAYALADDVDLKLAALYADIPWYHDLASTTAVTDVTGTRKVMVDNAVPLGGENVYYMVGSAFEKGLLDLAAFTQHQGGGERAVESQRRGYLGKRYGFEFFTNQNTPSHTAGTCADATGAIDLGAGYSKGDTTIHIDGVTDGGTWKAGDSFVIDGNTQRYAVTADVTFTGGEADVTFTPGLAADVANDAVVTGRVDTHTANLAFHRNAFALVMAPLPDMAKNLGAQVVTVIDPITGLSIRSRVYYVGNSSEVHVALDILYGVKTLDPNLAVRGCGA
jgi:hypothetical protein